MAEIQGEDAPLDKARQLVERNNEKVNELYASAEAPVLRFPTSAGHALPGSEPKKPYENTHKAFLQQLKRRRSAAPASSPAAARGGLLEKRGESAAGAADAPAEAGRGARKRGLEARRGPGTAVVVGKKARGPGMLTVRETAAALAEERPGWHAPWKMFRSIAGHAGWVRSIAVDGSNEWFATGSADRTVKIWDLASGRLKLTLTGHISAVRGIAISERHPYMFTVGEDKTVKCWDLEMNKVIRNYHGHLSGVYCVGLHPALDVLVTGGRDSTVRVWDVRTRAQVFVLGGHRDTVNAVIAQASDPQIVSASVDATVRMWDLAAGKCSGTLTNHKKGVRALVRHPREFSFASASADGIKTWGLPKGVFMRNLRGHKGLVNAMAVNEDGVLVSGGDDGGVRFWDYGAAHCFQRETSKLQPGSLECEGAIYALAFDRSGSRLISAEGDKTVKMWKEDSSATPDSHPVDWTPDLNPKRY